MGNMEKPLTWILAIGFMTLLAIANCDQLCSNSCDAEIVNEEQEILQNDTINVDEIDNAIKNMTDSLELDSAKVDSAN